MAAAGVGALGDGDEAAGTDEEAVEAVRLLLELGADINAVDVTIGLERLRLRTNSVVHNIGALLVFALTLVAIVFGLALALNPQFTGRPVGGTFFNLVLLGYGIPAILAAILALSCTKTAGRSPTARSRQRSPSVSRSCISASRYERSITDRF